MMQPDEEDRFTLDKQVTSLQSSKTLCSFFIAILLDFWLSFPISLLSLFLLPRLLVLLARFGRLLFSTISFFTSIRPSQRFVPLSFRCCCRRCRCCSAPGFRVSVLGGSLALTETERGDRADHQPSAYRLAPTLGRTGRKRNHGEKKSKTEHTQQHTTHSPTLSLSLSLCLQSRKYSIASA